MKGEQYIELKEREEEEKGRGNLEQEVRTKEGMKNNRKKASSLSSC